MAQVYVTLENGETHEFPKHNISTRNALGELVITDREDEIVLDFATTEWAAVIMFNR